MAISATPATVGAIHLPVGESATIIVASGGEHQFHQASSRRHLDLEALAPKGSCRMGRLRLEPRTWDKRLLIPVSDWADWCRCVRPERHPEQSGAVYVTSSDVASGGVRLHSGLHPGSAP
jgi:hypothetical protein